MIDRTHQPSSTGMGALSDLIRRDDHTVVIAEIGQAHDGSLAMAHAFIDAVARTGADAIKFQTHLAEAESTQTEQWRIRFSPKNETRYEYWKRMEFSEDEWRGLREHALNKNLYFISSPFSAEAADLLERVGVDAFKIASGEVTDIPLIERVLLARKPIMVSTGMSTISEIDDVVRTIEGGKGDLVLLQCTSSYPARPEQWGLNLISILKDRYGCPVGLSDHSGQPYAGLAAIALGAALVEVHVVFSRAMPGPDVAASLTIDELAMLVEGARVISKARSNPADKDELSDEIIDMRRLFMKRIVARESLPKGTKLRPSHLAAKKASTGMPASDLDKLVGRMLVRSLMADDPINEEDLS